MDQQEFLQKLADTRHKSERDQLVEDAIESLYSESAQQLALIQDIALNLRRLTDTVTQLMETMSELVGTVGKLVPDEDKRKLPTVYGAAVDSQSDQLTKTD